MIFSFNSIRQSHVDTKTFIRARIAAAKHRQALKQLEVNKILNKKRNS